MTFDEIMAKFIGKTVASFRAPSLNTDGTGPKNLIITFTDDSAITTIVDDFTMRYDSGTTRWTQGASLEALAEVMKSMR